MLVEGISAAGPVVVGEAIVHELLGLKLPASGELAGHAWREQLMHDAAKLALALAVLHEHHAQPARQQV